VNNQVTDEGKLE